MDVSQQQHIDDAMARFAWDDATRVTSVLKQTEYELTEEVMIPGVAGEERGPFVRKRIALDSGLGRAYQALYEHQLSDGHVPYLPWIEACYELAGELVVVMEHVPGETLQDAMKRLGPSLDLAADAMPKLCDAVMHLHASFDPPIIHRDLKPSNIMVAHDRLTLIDLGTARRVREGGGSDTVRFGTEEFAPPEQYGFWSTDVRSDVYSLGVLLFYCLAGRTFDPKHSDEEFAHIEALSVGAVDVRVAQGIRFVLKRATAFDPANRFESVAAFKQALLIALMGEPPVVRVEDLPVPKKAKPVLVKIGEFCWNGFLLFWWLLLNYACILNIVAPSTEVVYPLWVRIVEEVLWFGPGITLLLYLGAFKDFFAARIPFVAKHRSTPLGWGYALAFIAFDTIVFFMLCSMFAL